VVVGERSQLTRETLTDPLHVRGTRHGQSESTTRSHRQPVMLLVGETAVGVTLHVREWSQHETIRHRGTVGEGDRIEERRHLNSLTSGSSDQRIHRERTGNRAVDAEPKSLGKPAVSALGGQENGVKNDVKNRSEIRDRRESL
jgi:hypothetical protein